MLEYATDMPGGDELDAGGWYLISAQLLDQLWAAGFLCEPLSRTKWIVRDRATPPNDLLLVEAAGEAPRARPTRAKPLGRTIEFSRQVTSEVTSIEAALANLSIDHDGTGLVQTLRGASIRLRKLSARILSQRAAEPRLPSSGRATHVPTDPRRVRSVVSGGLPTLGKRR